MTPLKDGRRASVAGAGQSVRLLEAGHLSASLHRRAGTVMAEARLRSELRSIAQDVLGPGDSRELSPDIADWVRRASEAAVAAACDHALETLLTSIDTTVAGAPPSIAARLERAALAHDAGLD